MQTPAPIVETTCPACGEQWHAPAYRQLGGGEWLPLTTLCGPCARLVANALAEGALDQLRALRAQSTADAA